MHFRFVILLFFSIYTLNSIFPIDIFVYFDRTKPYFDGCVHVHTTCLCLYRNTFGVPLFYVRFDSNWGYLDLFGGFVLKHLGINCIMFNTPKATYFILCNIQTCVFGRPLKCNHLWNQWIGWQTMENLFENCFINALGSWENLMFSDIRS